MEGAIAGRNGLDLDGLEHVPVQSHRGDRVRLVGPPKLTGARQALRLPAQDTLAFVGKQEKAVIAKYGF